MHADLFINFSQALRPNGVIISAVIDGAAHVAYNFQKDDTGINVRELKLFESLFLFLTFEKTYQLDDVTRFRTRKRAVTVGHLHQFARGRDQELRRLCKITPWLPITSETIRGLLIDTIANRKLKVLSQFGRLLLRIGTGCYYRDVACF